jgi:hypothetical protein
MALVGKLIATEISRIPVIWRPLSKRSAAMAAPLVVPYLSPDRNTGDAHRTVRFR